MNTFKDMASLFHQLETMSLRANEELQIMDSRIRQLEGDYVNEKNKNRQLLNGIKELIENYDD